ncbi:MAG: hypothetical protein GX903_01345 [Spirochaetales bacterium]|nr:hypothetical protein [Spirochaetales bacterium]
MVNCKRCLLEEANIKAYQEVKHHIALIKTEERCDDICYQKRLLLCKACDKLSSGTCLSCGCYVELRASRTLLHCPNKKW